MDRNMTHHPFMQPHPQGHPWVRPWYRLQNVQDSCIFNFSAWYYGKAAPVYHGICSQYRDLQLPPLSVLFNQEVRHSVHIRSRLSGEKFCSCPSFFLRMDRNCFHGACRSRLQWFWVSFPILVLFAVLSFLLCSKHFVAPTIVWPHILPMVSAVHSLDSIFSTCLPIHKVGKMYTRALFNNYSTSPNGLWVNIDSWPMRASGIIVLVKSN